MNYLLYLLYLIIYFFSRECSDLAIKECIRNSEKSIEERCTQVGFLQSRLKQLCNENSVVEDQLNKCRSELKSELENLTLKLRNDLQLRQNLAEALVTKIKESDDQSSLLNAELVAITESYNIITERHRREEEERKKCYEMKLQRERAAVKIQRWYRIHTLRRLGKRRKKKTKRAKSSQKLHLQASRHKEENGGNSAAILAIDEDARKDNGELATGSFATNGSPLASSPVPSCNHQTNKLQRSTSSPIKRITVQMTSVVSENSVDQPADSTSSYHHQSSQTDNRVPKTKVTYKKIRKIN